MTESVQRYLQSEQENLDHTFVWDIKSLIKRRNYLSSLVAEPDYSEFPKMFAQERIKQLDCAIDRLKDKRLYKILHFMGLI